LGTDPIRNTVGRKKGGAELREGEGKSIKIKLKKAR